MIYLFKKEKETRQNPEYGSQYPEVPSFPVHSGCWILNAEFFYRRGFTLIELLVVMVIIGLLAALVAPRFLRQEEKAKVKVARAQIELLGTALDTLRLDVGRYPTTQESLEALRRQPGSLERWDGSYLKKEVPLDPWGRPYIYRSPGEHGPYDLISYGADGQPGGEGNNRDITSWGG